MNNDIEYSLELPPYSPAFIEALIALGGDVFEHVDGRHVTWRLSNMPELSTFVAATGGRYVGFKTGYALSERRYYSWLGGVHPDFRRNGIASQLMLRQHEWLMSRHYTSVETATDQNNHAMCHVNLVHGFAVCGLRTYPERTQILFSKQLD